jgi:BioD-like phosphotransacetylase family protein
MSMKPLYITAVITLSGKTALALGIGLRLQAAGRKVGYLKPVSLQPYLLDGKIVDEDAEFVGRTLGLDTPPADLAPIVIDDLMLDKLLRDQTNRDFAADVKTAFDRNGKGKDVLLIEGGGSLREGSIVGLSPIKLSQMFDVNTLGTVRYRSNAVLLDDTLAMREHVGVGRDRLIGVIINSVPNEAMDQVKGKIVPFLERQGIRVFGVLPLQRSLQSVSVDELNQVLNARVLNKPSTGEELIENLSVGAMSVESAMPNFRRTQKKAVITGGDRADIQAAALDTSTTALVLTGNLMPSSTILKHAEERGVAVLLVPYNTIETVERVERVFGKNRLAHPEKLNRFRDMLDANLDWTRLLEAAGF